MSHRFRIRGVVLATSFGFSRIATAATINVPADQPTIQACINVAVSGVDECLVAPGIYVENINLLGKAITVRTSGGAPVTTIDGGLSGSVVTCASGEGLGTVIDGFKILNGRGTLQAGFVRGCCLYNRNSSPTVLNSIFTNNAAEIGSGMYNDNNAPVVTGCLFQNNIAEGTLKEGGGMHNNGSDATVTNCQFIDNLADTGGGMFNVGNVTVTGCEFAGNRSLNGNGGAMWNGGSLDVNIDACTFNGNRAEWIAQDITKGRGGAIFVQDITFNVTNSEFNTNTGFSMGGAIQAQATFITITGTTFRSNASSFTGGAVHVSGGSASIDNCGFLEANNVSTGDGGALVIGSAVADVTGCTFDSNTASVRGGAVFLFQCIDCNVTACSFTSNQAFGTGSAVFGGGAFFSLDGSPTMTGCTFTGNFASSSGGAIHSIGSMDVTDCTFTDNNCNQAGGAIHNRDGSSMSLDTSTFTGNTALQGGGMYNGNSGALIVDCAFSANSASPPSFANGGGAIADFASNVSIFDTTFTGNQVLTNSGSGGAINHADGGSLNARRCTFDSNTAVGAGGAVRWNTAPPSTLVDSHFIDNTSGFRGGAVLATGAMWMINCRFERNVATNEGGAVLGADAAGAPVVINSTFVGNTGSHGGGYHSFSGVPFIRNCTILQNIATSGQGNGINAQGPDCFIDNCIIRQHSGGQMFGASFTISYTNITNGLAPLWTDAGGNIDAPAEFIQNPSPGSGGWDGVGDSFGNLRVQESSPCIDAGSNLAVSGDLADLDLNSITAERTPLDLDGKLRFTDVPSVPDTGVADPPDYTEVVDMGAYELPSALGPVLYVDADATGANNGSSWSHAFVFLQDGLAAASAGSAVWVAEGTYHPDDGAGVTSGDRTATFQLSSGVAVHGGFAGVETALSERDPEANVTVLSGDVEDSDTRVACTQDSPDCDAFGSLCSGDGLCIIADNNAENSYHVVTGSGTDASAEINGFTITGGNANGAHPHTVGGGMFNNNGDPTVADCVFLENTAVNGGGGMYNESNSGPTVTGCTFSGNTVTVGGNGGGGGMNNLFSSPTVGDCTFRGNATAFAGGGMTNWTNSSPTITNCRFLGNSATSGGGMYNTFTNSPTITNCTFSGNTASDGGGIRNVQGSSPRLTNSTFSGNSALAGGGMSNSNGAVPIIINCILWGNSPNGIFNLNPAVDNPTVSFSDVQGGLPAGTIDGGGNIDIDPLFVDADGSDDIVGTEDDNLRLRSGSTAIDAADNLAVPVGITTDLDGDPRFIDDPATTDTGNGAPPIVDMGAYEFQPAPIPTVSEWGLVVMSLLLLAAATLVFGKRASAISRRGTRM